MADVGLPDGLVGAVTVRAHRHVHMHAGAGHNSVSPGARLGVQFVVGDRVAPYLAAEGGHYLAGDANPFARGLAARAGAGDAELERLGYSFASAHLGLRLGGRGAAFYMQGGVSFVRPVMSFRETSTAQMSDDITVDVISESVFHVWTPSARVGLIAYF